jgi:Protein of unknown function (DUF550)
MANELAQYLEQQEEWSSVTFGNGVRTLGVTGHIRKELEEIEASPHDVMEWVDVIILAMDGYWRAGGNPDRLMKLLQIKQYQNMQRKWPFPPPPEDQPSEHTQEAQGTANANPTSQDDPPEVEQKAILGS